MKNKIYLTGSLVFAGLISACNVTGPAGIFGKKSPHETYSQKITEVGLKQTALGKSWLDVAESSIAHALKITIPYKERGYFPANKALAVGLKFQVARGERISIALNKKPASGFTVFLDLWEERKSQNKKLLAFADTNGSPFSYDIDEDGVYILRLQPELLTSGEYTLTISRGPSLAFPVKNGKIGSFWGADRDEGARRHEGIDIFAAKRTPALAAADGTVNRVGVNKLGGKVVFLRPDKKEFSLYYAHLDEQLVTEGQRVKEGDTIGLVGNTGNAIHTSPHLHFGIYTFGGAINPLPFVNPLQREPRKITAPIEPVGKLVRARVSASLRESPEAESEKIISLKDNTIMDVQAASGNWYKVSLPDGKSGFVSSSSVESINNPLRQLKLSQIRPLLDRPDSTASRKRGLAMGVNLKVLGKFDDYYLVTVDEDSGWIVLD